MHALGAIRSVLTNPQYAVFGDAAVLIRIALGWLPRLSANRSFVPHFHSRLAQTRCCFFLMSSNYSQELKKLLTKAGCVFVRHGKGDHDIWRSPITNMHFPVDSVIKSRHTANAVLCQTGLLKAFKLREEKSPSY